MTIHRRGFLGALALAPAALAACSTPGAAAKPRTVAERDPGAAPQVAAGVAAVRSFALSAAAEPAFVFRAAVPRPGEP